MPSFETIILNTFGEKGGKWLENLPSLVKSLEKRWNLSHLSPVPNMTYHFVAKALQDSQIPVVIKIGCDAPLIEMERRVLQEFDGKGMIALLDYDANALALLLKQAIPGTTLKTIASSNFNEALLYYATLIKELKHSSPSKGFHSLSSYLKSLDEGKNETNPLFRKAAKLKNRLLEELSPPQLLHGDLHLDNILLDGDKWVAIDPKGVRGEIEFELAAFDFFLPEERETATTSLFLKRISALSEAADVSFEKLKGWVFVRLVLAARWSIEDSLSPHKFLKLASLLQQD